MAKNNDYYDFTFSLVWNDFDYEARATISN